MNKEVELETGGRIVVDALARNGLTRVFCVPGESYLPVLDALHDHMSIELVVCRQEGGATMMAEAYAKTTGQPSACFVTRGPGAANAMAGLHVAAQGSTPLLLFVGQVPRGHRDREAWQEIDLRALFAPQAKWVGEVSEAARLAEYVNRAFHVATSGRPGPVVVVLPEDVLYEEAPPSRLVPWRPTQTHPLSADLERLREHVESARKPLLLVGGGGWSQQTQAAVEEFAGRHGVPIVTSFRRQDYADNNHGNYAGHAGLGMNPALAQRITEADLLLVVGARLGDVATRHYTLVDVPRPRQRLVHVHANAEELGRVYQPDLAICANAGAFAQALRRLPAPASVPAARLEWIRGAHREYLAWSDPSSCGRGRELADIVAWLSNTLPDDAVISNGAGNYTLWLHRFYRFRRYGSQLAPTSGSMGYGLPAAIAATLADGHRTAVCFAGDGCLMMTSQELATLAHYGLKLIIVVVNNGMYGSIRMHQQRRYPGRLSGTRLSNPDFVVFAQSFGLAGYRVVDATGFRDAFARATDDERSAVIELVMDEEALTP